MDYEKAGQVHGRRERSTIHFEEVISHFDVQARHIERRTQLRIPQAVRVDAGQAVVVVLDRKIRR